MESLWWFGIKSRGNTDQFSQILFLKLVFVDAIHHTETWDFIYPNVFQSWSCCVISNSRPVNRDLFVPSPHAILQLWILLQFFFIISLIIEKYFLMWPPLLMLYHSICYFTSVFYYCTIDWFLSLSPCKFRSQALKNYCFLSQTDHLFRRPKFRHVR